MGSSGSKNKKKNKSKNKKKGKGKDDKSTKPKKKSKKKVKKKNDENGDTGRHRLQLIYAQLSTLKSSHNKRMESIKTCSKILDNPNCNASTVKFAINAFKKIFVQQLKDKKFEIHQELYLILSILIKRHYKAYKLKNGIFLSLLLEHIGHIKNEKEQIALDQIIKTIIKRIATKKDEKQFIVILNKCIRNGTNSKHKNIKQKSWHFLHIALDEKYTKNQNKMSLQILDCIENCFKYKQSDKISQEHCFKVLNFLSQQNENERFHKLYTKHFSVSAQRQYDKLYTAKKRSSNKLNVINKREKRVSVGQYNIDTKRLSAKYLKKRDSLEKLKKAKIKTKRNKKKKKKKKNESNEDLKEIKQNILADINASNGNQSKLQKLYNSKAKKKKRNVQNI